MSRIVEFLRNTPWPRLYGAALALLVGVVGIWWSWVATDADGAADGFGSISVWDRLLATLIWLVVSALVVSPILFLGRAEK